MTNCPICGQEAKPLDRTGDAEGFDCSTHGPFKVGGTALTTRGGESREAWEKALQRAKDRTKPGEYPTINGYDF